MRRREILAGLGAAAVWPHGAPAQQRTLPVIGFLSGRSPGEAAAVVASFHRGLAETGHAEGRNVAVEYRWAEGRYDRLPAMAAELVERRVAVLAAVGGGVAGLAAKAATATIPIVFASGGDAVKIGLVESLNRPGANVTGVNLVFGALGAKRLELSRDFADAGGLVSYGGSIIEGYRQVGKYVGQILLGAKPADLPVVQPAIFELVVNPKTAHTLGLAIPPGIIARADVVIE